MAKTDRAMIWAAYQKIASAKKILHALKEKGFLIEDNSKQSQELARGGLSFLEKTLENAEMSILHFSMQEGFHGMSGADNSLLIHAYIETKTATFMLANLIDSEMITENLQESKKLWRSGGLVKIGRDLEKSCRILTDLLPQTFAIESISEKYITIRESLLLAYGKLRSARNAWRLLKTKKLLTENYIRWSNQFKKTRPSSLEKRIEIAHASLSVCCFQGPAGVFQEKTGIGLFIRALVSTISSGYMLDELVANGKLTEDLKESTKLIAAGGLVQIRKDLAEARKMLHTIQATIGKEL